MRNTVRGEDKKEFLWQWVYEIEKSDINKNINLATTEQKKYSYKFSRILDESNKKEIHEHINIFGEKTKNYSKKMIEYKELGYDKFLLNTVGMDELNILDSYKKFINIKEGKVAIIQIGWKKTNYLIINKTKEGFLELSCDEEQTVKLDTTKENGMIFIGKVGDIETGYAVPIVGKAFKKKKEYDNCISLIEKNLELIKDFTENKQSIDCNNETELIVEEGRECVYLKIKFKDYCIIGFTNPNYGKKGFKEFINEYAKSKCFQVQISCEETEDVLFYIVNGNATVVKNY